jgi:hypothetical protein
MLLRVKKLSPYFRCAPGELRLRERVTMTPSSLIPAAAVLLTALTSLPARAQTISLIDQIDVTNGAEIVTFSPDGDTVATNVTDTAPNIGVQLFSLAADGSLTAREFVSVSDEFSGAIASVSSVALDPLGRGFGVMSVIPLANRTANGVVVFFDYRAGSVAVLETRSVGFHPDSVSFSRDGSKVFVANEGEFTGSGNGEGGGGGDTDAPGSVSVIDLTGVTGADNLSTNLDSTDVTTVDFSAANLAAGVTLGALRFNDNTFTVGNAHRHVEPEYITEGEGVIYVTLQENNAIAELTLSGVDANKFTAIYPLGTITQTIDASDQDGVGGAAAALIDDVVKGVPMPDTIASYAIGGQRFLVTANEGDFRPDDADRIRISSGTFTGLDTGVTIDRANAVLGRLRVVKDLADPDNDNLINEVIMPGTRSFSIWNADTGALVGDTGSFEPLLLGIYPTLHNMNGESSSNGTTTFDLRSPDKGPEPEALAHAKIGANDYVFVGMERQGAILMFNVNDPANPAFVTSINNLTDGLAAPESISVISAANSPTGNPLLLIGYEIGGKIGVYSLTDSAPVITTPARVTVTGKTRKVTLKGRASANTGLVTIDDKPARGTTSWSGKVPFPTSKSRLKVDIEATSDFGVSSARKVTIVRKP